MYSTLIIATLTATSLMTLFSYVVSWMFGQPFKEPLLLAILLNNLHLADNTINRVLGWILHYLLGLVFVIGFEFIINAGWGGINADTAMVYGASIGLIGIIGWQVMFNLSNKKPSMDYIGYYMQLFIAHIVFAFTTVGTYKIL